MGVDTRRPHLPAPTDSTFHDTTGGSVTGTDLATDLSRRTDRTSYSIPEDGSPVTISTRRKSNRDDGKFSRGSHHSQTSLLIEYFEGGKKGNGLHSRPSVRVRVTPSSSRKGKDQSDRVHVSDSGIRKPSYTRRISLGTPSRTREITEGGPDDRSISSLNSGGADDGSGRRMPVEIEFVNRDSEVSARYIQPTSDISSIPPDSMLDNVRGASDLHRRRSNSISGDELEDSPSRHLLKTPARARSRSLSRERIAHKAAEKLNQVPRDRSISKQQYDEANRSRDMVDYTDRSARRRAAKYRDSKELGSPEPSFLNHSITSGPAKSGDQYSFQSGTSRSSLNNPRLLETVEDAIRRLILPELKELKKDQKVETNKKKFDQGARTIDTSGSKGDIQRRLSKHASAPDVSKPRVVVSEDHQDAPETPLASPDSRRSKERRRQKRSSPHQQRTNSRRSSTDHTIGEIALARKKSKALRDAEAANIVGSTLTAAALRHHDSITDLDSQEERSNGSNSPLDAPKINETELIFQKHNVAPMPFRSEIETDITRDSLLSHQSAGTATALEGEVSRRSPYEVASPAPGTPTGKSRDNQEDLQSRGSDVSTPEQEHYDKSDWTGVDDTTLTENFPESPGYSPHPQYTGAGYSNTRALSPIQSVASYQEQDDAKDIDVRNHSRESTPVEKYRSQEEHTEYRDEDHDAARADDIHRLSIATLSSAASTDLARSIRTSNNSDKRRGFTNQEDESGVELGYGASPKIADPHQVDSEGEGSHRDMDSTPNGSSVNFKRMSSHTEGSYDDDPLHSGQQVERGIGASPKFVHPPMGMESAVASLLDPSTLETGSNRSPAHSVSNALNQSQSHSPRLAKEDQQDYTDSRRGSPLKHQLDASSPMDDRSFHARMGVTSPPQSVANSSDEIDGPIMGATALPTAGSPIPEIGHNLESEESEINTNPSIIQGPIGGVGHEDRDHWPYNPTPPESGARMLPEDDDYDINDPTLGMGAGANIGMGLGAIPEELHDNDDDDYFGRGMDGRYTPQQNIPTTADLYENDHLGVISPGVRDEGYISGANHRSTSTPTPELKKSNGLGLKGLSDFESPLDSDKALSESHKRHLSGYSHGMPSPIYDSSTGRGIDRIQSKDIVALMDHLTVRDAQRNARDTEILVTLVRSAAEMRNSFETMKKFIAQQDELLIESNNKQHDRTHKIVGGPRPLPAAAPRALSKQSGDYEAELRSKKKNVFKRALKNLSLKSNNDLTNIEDMLVHLLAEVEALRAVQEGRLSASDALSGRENSTENVRNSLEHQEHIAEPLPAKQPAAVPNNTRSLNQFGTRVSTVQEEDEDLEPLTPDEQELMDHQMTTNAQLVGHHKRGGSVPIASPDRAPMASGGLSADTTPKTVNEKSRKNKSNNSSFFPKISRWSRTTASSMGENLRNSIQPNRKERMSSEMSRSGSDLEPGVFTTAEYYDPHGDDRLRSNTSFNDKQENRPPSPLVPSQLSENPKYHAHRDSFNLQHPQPRQGPTARYQTHLESQAQNFGMPISPESDRWGSNVSLSASRPNQTAGNGRRKSSPISDGGYSVTSSALGSQGYTSRQPKTRDEGPLVPSRPPKSDGSSHASYAERMAMRENVRSGNYDSVNGSPSRSSPRRNGPQRRPTGPRPINSSGKQYSDRGDQSNTQRRQYRGSPEHSDDDDDY